MDDTHAEIIARHADAMENISLYLGRIGDLMSAMCNQICAVESHITALEQRIIQLESK